MTQRTNLSGFFARKPSELHDLHNAIKEANKQGLAPTSIRTIGKLNLPVSDYESFEATMSIEEQVLKPWANKAVFTRKGANCLLITAEGKQSIAIVLEGYTYVRYAALVVNAD